MPVFADMKPVLEFADGERSEEVKEKLFHSLKMAFFNVASTHAPALKNDPDFRMEVVTDAFEKLHKKSINFHYENKGRERAVKTAYAFVYRIMWNSITQKKRKMKYIDFDEDDGDSIIERIQKEEFQLDKVISCMEFNKEISRVFARARVFGIKNLSFNEAMLDLGSQSGELVRAVLVRCLFPHERKRTHEA